MPAILSAPGKLSTVEDYTLRLGDYMAIWARVHVIGVASFARDLARRLFWPNRIPRAQAQLAHVDVAGDDTAQHHGGDGFRPPVKTEHCKK